MPALFLTSPLPLFFASWLEVPLGALTIFERGGWWWVEDARNERLGREKQSAERVLRKLYVRAVDAGRRKRRERERALCYDDAAREGARATTHAWALALPALAKLRRLFGRRVRSLTKTQCSDTPHQHQAQRYRSGCTIVSYQSATLAEKHTSDRSGFAKVIGEGETALLCITLSAFDIRVYG